MHRALMPCALIPVVTILALVQAPASVSARDAGQVVGPAPLAVPRLPVDVLARAQGLFEDRPDGSPPARLAGEKASTGLDAVLLMCDFADSLLVGRWGQVAGEFPPPQQAGLLYAAHDSVYFDHLMRDVATYFRTVSGDVCRLRWTVHPRVVNLPHGMAWYGNHPTEGDQQLQLAADVMDSLAVEIDFSAYDTVILVHAGAGEETDVHNDSPEQVYSTFLDPTDFERGVEDGILADPWLPGGVDRDHGIDRVLVLPECEFQDPDPPLSKGMLGNLGVYCYEIGLRLGMVSLVDFTPAGNADSQGIGTLGLMGYGLFVASGWNPPHPSAFNKLLMGWVQPFDADPAAGAVHRLRPAESPADPLSCARVDITGREYWLLEYRLQDPDGNRFWTFDGDSNGNFRRDFWDASSADGVPPAGAKFDPATDTREWLVGAEWDHFMTETGSNVQGLGGGGSGVYVWHVDEGIIADRYGAGTNLFNSDPARKAVDVEEADGIQDLDSSQPSSWWLGGDDDAFRGEGAHRFAGDTLPRTDTAGGAWTGIEIRDFSDVLVDARAYIAAIVEGDTLWGHVYADHVDFRVAREPEQSGPVRAAERVLPAGTDLRGSHVLIGEIDGDPAAREIVLAGRAGEVFLLNGDLNEVVDHDDNPATCLPLVVGRRADEDVNWNLPAALGDLDGDGAAEIVLTGPDGLYAFNGDGSPVRDIEAGAVGLYADLPPCRLPPVLVPTLADAPPGPGTAVEAAVIVVEAGSAHLRLLAGPDGTTLLDHDLGPVDVRAPPVFARGRLWVAAADTVSGHHSLFGCATTSSSPAMAPVLSFDLEMLPGHFPPTWGVEPGARGRLWIAVSALEGGGETVLLDEGLAPAGGNLLWPTELQVRSPVAGGGALVSSDVFGRIGMAGYWHDGWPRRPLPAVTGVDSSWAPGPVVARLLGSGRPVEQVIFPARDGRLYGLGHKGEAEPGWVLAGPGQAAATPALGQVTGDSTEDLVAVGSFARVTGVDPAVTGLESATRSVVTVWAEVALADGSWPMWGGSPWRNGEWAAEAWRTDTSSGGGGGFVSGSHICYPNPLRGTTLNVRASLRSPGRVRVQVYNLEGELVTDSAWAEVPALEPFSVPVSVARAVSGIYLCRLVAETAEGTVASVVPFAIER